MANEAIKFTLTTAVPAGSSRYRYRLDRGWGKDPSKDEILCFVLCNPSRATEAKSDPTVSACCKVAEHWGYRRICIGNLFSLRDPKPTELSKGRRLWGPDHWRHFRRALKDAKEICVAWGRPLSEAPKDKQLTALKKFDELAQGRRLLCLEVLGDGRTPCHPQRKDLRAFKMGKSWEITASLVELFETPASKRAFTRMLNAPPKWLKEELDRRMAHTDAHPEDTIPLEQALRMARKSLQALRKRGT